MKKLVLSAAVAVLGLAGANAQVGMESVELGARAGYNHTIVGGDAVDAYDIEGKSGFHVGLFAEFPVAPKFSVQPEVQYSTTAASANIALQDVDIKTQNLTIPVLGKYYVADGFNLQFGPQMRIHTGNDSDFGTFVSEDDIDDMFKPVTFDLVAGAGYKIAQGLTVDARYNFGLSPVLDDENAYVKALPGIDDMKTSIFQIGLGYQF